MSEPKEQQFTLEEIEQAIDCLNVDSRNVVLAALQSQREAKEVLAKEESWRRQIWRFAVCFERATADNASDSNIEGWHEELIEGAERLLARFETRKEPSAVEMQVRHTAALAYTYLTQERNYDDIDVQLLTNVGEDPRQILAEFREGIIESCVESGQERAEVTSQVMGEYTALNDLEGISHPDFFNRIVIPHGIVMREGLKAAGFQLPELDEEGQYGEDDDVVWQKW